MSDLARVTFDGNERNCVAAIAGEIDISNVDFIRATIDDHLVGHAGLIIDLSETTFLDSAGVALLLGIADRLRVTRHTFHVVIPVDASIRRVVTLSGLDGQMHIAGRLADVIDAHD
jgi:anti-anti-sigma factor